MTPLRETDTARTGLSPASGGQDKGASRVRELLRLLRAAIAVSPREADASGGQDNGALRVRSTFRWLRRAIAILALLTLGYWMFSSDRYVSEAIVLVQHTEKIGMAALDMAALLGGSGGSNRQDQMLLREYLLSVDMMNKVNDALDLRAHYSDTRHDIASRMWFKNASVERFHRHYLSRVRVEYDDFAGVIRIRAQAYDPKTARGIADMLVTEGERHMNEISHELARAQVNFLETQVALAHDKVLQTSQILLDFQNQKGMASPLASVESISAIIAKLEGQRMEVQTRIASLPRTLAPDHSTIVMLRQTLAAVERQIAVESAKLASTSGNPLNSLVVQEQRLRLEVDFKKDVYKTALVALEQGRTDASRTIKKASVLQTPLLPEYPLEPRRIYGITATLCVFLIVSGIARLLESIILDHVD